jgi:hypothetical protein
VLSLGFVGSKSLPNLAILAFEKLANGDVVGQGFEHNSVHSFILKK